MFPAGFDNNWKTLSGILGKYAIYIYIYKQMLLDWKYKKTKIKHFWFMF